MVQVSCTNYKMQYKESNLISWKQHTTAVFSTELIQSMVVAWVHQHMHTVRSNAQPEWQVHRPQNETEYLACIVLYTTRLILLRVLAVYLDGKTLAIAQVCKMEWAKVLNAAALQGIAVRSSNYIWEV